MIVALDGQTTTVVRPVTVAPSATGSVSELAYDDDGKVTRVTVDGVAMATPSYSASQELTSLACAGAVSLRGTTRDSAHRTTGPQWGGGGRP